MTRFGTTWAVALLLLASPALATKVKLKCSPGYSITVTFEIHIPRTEAEREMGMATSYTDTISCPPDAEVDLPDSAKPYDGLHAEWDMTDPAGNPSSGSLPPAPAPGDPPPGRYAPWGVHPLAPNSYHCNSITCWDDPIAPTFIHPGEFVIGQYEDGATFELNTQVDDATTLSPIGGASVAVHRVSDDSVAASGQTDPSGSSVLSVDAGGVYYIRAESGDHVAQRSDEFMVLRDHGWRMLLTPSSSEPADPGWYRWLLVVLILLVLLLLWRGRSRSP